MFFSIVFFYSSNDFGVRMVFDVFVEVMMCAPNLSEIHGDIENEVERVSERKKG